jgi:hypothetical protein
MKHLFCQVLQDKVHLFTRSLDNMLRRVLSFPTNSTSTLCFECATGDIQSVSKDLLELEM